MNKITAQIKSENDYDKISKINSIVIINANTLLSNRQTLTH